MASTVRWNAMRRMIALLVAANGVAPRAVVAPLVAVLELRPPGPDEGATTVRVHLFRGGVAMPRCMYRVDALRLAVAAPDRPGGSGRTDWDSDFVRAFDAVGPCGVSRDSEFILPRGCTVGDMLRVAEEPAALRVQLRLTVVDAMRLAAGGGAKSVPPGSCGELVEVDRHSVRSVRTDGMQHHPLHWVVARDGLSPRPATARVVVAVPEGVATVADPDAAVAGRWAARACAQLRRCHQRSQERRALESNARRGQRAAVTHLFLRVLSARMRAHR